MTTSIRNSGRSTGSDAWAALGGLALGLVLSAVLRRRRQQRRTRAVLVALGLNAAAFCLVGLLLAVGLEPGRLADRWVTLLLIAGGTAVFGTPVFRFPRAVGLPVLLILGAGSWLVFQAVNEFRPLGPDFSPPRVQPLTDREIVTAFALRADFLEVPDVWLVTPPFYRLRASAAEPPEWWWTWAVARGWAHSAGAEMPAKPMKFGVYRLALDDGEPRWELISPEVAPPP